MLDLHTHVLPGIDDGPRSLEESLALLRALCTDGVHHVVATPHMYPGVYDNEAEGIRRTFDQVKAALDEAKLPLTLSWGAEVRLCHEMIEWLDTGRLVCLGRQADGRSTVLVELPDGLVPMGTEALLRRLADRGVVPLLAHPERNRALAENPDRLQALLDTGALVQLTAASVLGEFGSRAQQAAQVFLERGWVSAVASDAHNLRGRKPALGRAREWLAQQFGEDTAHELTEAQPARLCGLGELLAARTTPAATGAPVLRDFGSASSGGCAVALARNAEGRWIPLVDQSATVPAAEWLSDWTPGAATPASAAPDLSLKDRPGLAEVPTARPPSLLDELGLLSDLLPQSPAPAPAAMPTAAAPRATRTSADAGELPDWSSSDWVPGWDDTSPSAQWGTPASEAPQDFPPLDENDWSPTQPSDLLDETPATIDVAPAPADPTPAAAPGDLWILNLLDAEPAPEQTCVSDQACVPAEAAAEATVSAVSDTPGGAPSPMPALDVAPEPEAPPAKPVDAEPTGALQPEPSPEQQLPTIEPEPATAPVDVAISSAAEEESLIELDLPEWVDQAVAAFAAGADVAQPEVATPAAEEPEACEVSETALEDDTHAPTGVATPERHAAPHTVSLDMLPVLHHRVSSTVDLQVEDLDDVVDVVARELAPRRTAEQPTASNPVARPSKRDNPAARPVTLDVDIPVSRRPPDTPVIEVQTHHDRFASGRADRVRPHVGNAFSLSDFGELTDDTRRF